MSQISLRRLPLQSSSMNAVYCTTRRMNACGQVAAVTLGEAVMSTTSELPHGAP